jgi:hypothetical protein
MSSTSEFDRKRKVIVEMRLMTANDIATERGYPLDKAGAVLKYTRKVLEGLSIGRLTTIGEEELAVLLTRAASGYDTFMDKRKGFFGGGSFKRK